MTEARDGFEALEAKCRLLEGRCSEYVERLKSANQALEGQVSKLKEAEARMLDSEARFRKVFEYAPFGAAMTDMGGKIVLANRAMCKMMGYPKSEIEGLHFSEFTHPDDQGTNIELFKKLVSNEIDHYRMEKKYVRKSGKVIWGSLAVILVNETQHDDTMIIGMVEDISKQKQVEAELKKHRDNLEAIVADRTSEIRSLKDRLQAENILLKQELADTHRYGAIIGQSLPMKSVISQIALVAPTKSSVLIQGASGTGKELVAREIHRNSDRKTHAFIRVNCAAIPKELYESEFFGHVKGAYTGAVRDRIGRFEAADGGTIFLDEVGEIPLSLQTKLLRVLQEGEYERLGEEKTRTVDVRVIAATNKKLREEVNNKTFRDDLFYRLNVFPIYVPPLKDRVDDIPLLATHFIEKLSKGMNLPRPHLTRANILDLQAYKWPGNVRELENAIERAMILSRSKKLNFKPVLSDGDRLPILHAGQDAAGSSVDGILSDNELRELERDNMIRALEHCNWKIYTDEGAARLLGIKPTTMIERMKRMKIKKPQKTK